MAPVLGLDTSLQLYQNDGQFINYAICAAQLDGETIPPNELRSLFPLSQFANKRVLVHRDGLFRGQEQETLLQWGSEIDSEFYFVEIMKKTPPRLYGFDGEVTRPQKGTAFRLSGDEAIVVSSPPPFGAGTPRPLRIKTYSPFTIEQAIHSVLSLTLLHHGSLNPPRLPITIHHSDRIAYLANRNIWPGTNEGSDQYWL